MNLSVLDLFTIGIGPSSSHTVGPMRAAHRFVSRLRESGRLPDTAHVEAHLYGSLALTGRGHGTDRAVILGLEGELPESVDVDGIPERLEAVRASGRLNLGGERSIPFEERKAIVFHRMENLPGHPNGLRFRAVGPAGETILEGTWYSIGGGFVVEEGEGADAAASRPASPVDFQSAAELLECCRESGPAVSDVMLRHEAAWRPEAETRAALLRVWQAMRACVERGCRQEGTLPGGLHVPRRAPSLFRELSARPEPPAHDPLVTLDWVNLWAIAVNEENASGGRVVTAPTNGAAGIMPAVLHFLVRDRPETGDDDIVRFLLTAGAIAMLYKRNASISGAEVGCQGEVGVACSMAAAALCERVGGTPAQVENAAEIGMEHNLGLTCDPIGGLVQIPCIERNAMGAVKAINAARLALRGDGRHTVSLDRVIAVMRQTGRDMSSKYKETSRGGLAVSFTEC